MNSIRTKIVLITMISLTLLGTAFVLYSIATTGNYKRLRLEDVEKTVAFETEKINKLIAELELCAIQAASGGLLFSKAQSNEVGETLLLELLRGFPAAIGCGFWFEPYAYDKDTFRAGMNAYFDTSKNKACMDDSYIMDEYDFHNQPWYREIIDAVKSP